MPQPTFDAFVEAAEPRLRRALVARYGADTGRDVLAEALAYGWEHWDRVEPMENRTGYLYRVAQSKARKYFGRRAAFPDPAASGLPWIEPGLPNALSNLSGRQRQAVVLVHAFDWTHAEVAELLGVSRSSIQNHVERGLAKLRSQLGDTADV